ncbi:MAG: TDT family transporter [Brevinema sp.]
MSFIDHLTKMPIALASVALGTAGITGAWTSVVNNPNIGIIGAGIASILVIILLLKYIIHPSLFLKEISCPTLGSVIPTLDMAIMLIASVIVQFAPLLGKSLWIGAVILHTIFFIKFLQHRIKEFDLNHMLPSWFVPPVGIVVSCVSGAEMGFPFLTTGLFYFGFSAYMILLPCMFYRMFFGDRIENSRLPAFGVMGAPANLCLAGYLTAFPEPSYYFTFSLAYLGFFTTCLVYISMIRVFQIKFFPLYAAYTFPLGIGATAMIKFCSYLQTTTTPPEIIQIWTNIAYTELLIASIVICYIFVNLKVFLWRNIKNN